MPPKGEATGQLKVRKVGQLKINSSELTDFGMVYGKNVKAYVCHKKHVYMLVICHIYLFRLYIFVLQKGGSRAWML